MTVRFVDGFGAVVLNGDHAAAAYQALRAVDAARRQQATAAGRSYERPQVIFELLTELRDAAVAHTDPPRRTSATSALPVAERQPAGRAARSPSTSPQEPPTMSTAEAAKLLGVTSRTVRHRCKHGQLRAHKVGRAWRIPVIAVVDGGAADERTPQ